MTETPLEGLGPVDYIVVEFPAGASNFTGEMVKELLLAHAKPGLHGVYDLYAYLDEKRRALELWGVRLRAIVEPKLADL